MAAEAEGSLVPVPTPSAALGYLGHPKISGGLSPPACTAGSAVKGKGDGLGVYEGVLGSCGTSGSVWGVRGGFWGALEGWGGVHLVSKGGIGCGGGLLSIMGCNPNAEHSP